MKTINALTIPVATIPASHEQNKMNPSNDGSKTLAPIFLSPKITTGTCGDIHEKGADVMYDKVLQVPGPVNFLSANNNMQRKCAPCKEEEKRLQKKENVRDLNTNASPFIDKVINSSSGKSLDPHTRAFMEPRFNYDFSKVKIHDNDVAAKSANSINALAYTSGDHVVFNSGKYNPDSDPGKKLLAHELTHVVQQKNNISAKKIQRQPSTSPAVPKRGPNPSLCLIPFCAQLRNPSPGCLNNPKSCAQTWIANVIACLRTNSSASNASHAAEIISNTQKELSTYIAYMDSLQPVSSASDKQNYANWLSSLCVSKQRELFIEFHHNIIFDNVPTITGPSSLKPWGDNPSDWDEIEQALVAIPDEHLWGRGTSQPVVHFTRKMQHPSGTSVGGETDPDTSTISIYDTGVGPAPYGRSAGTGIPATHQTIRHEVGHLVDQSLPLSGSLNDFIEKIIGWHFYPLSFLVTNPPANDTHRTFQTQLCTELQFLNSSGGCDHSKLLPFIDGIAMNGSIFLNDREYSRTKSSIMSWPVGAVPGGIAFSYARTSPSDYFAEVYSLSVSNADFIYRSLPLNQIEWLRQHVFHTQTIYDELISPYTNLATTGNEMLLNRYEMLIQSARRKFTRQQLEPISLQLQSLLLQITSHPADAAVG